MPIAVISDTHNRIPPHVLSGISGAECIWHLGDVTDAGVLDEIRSLGPPVLVVRGNCDLESSGWPLEERLELCGWRILLIHIPPRVPPPGVDILLHGHTHVPRNEIIAGARCLNPGCITRPNRGAPASYAWLDLKPGREPGWRLVRI